MGPKPSIARSNAQALYVAGIPIAQICERLSLKPGTVNTWASRQKWRLQRDSLKEDINQASVLTVQRSLFEASEALRQRFAGTLAKHADALDLVAVKPSLRHLQQFGQALEPLTRAAKTVFDWGSTDGSGLVVVGRMKQAVEAEAEVISLPAPASPIEDPAVAQEELSLKPGLIPVAFPTHTQPDSIQPDVDVGAGI
jgi:hypothetical protein